jgi:hypothetical protein
MSTIMQISRVLNISAPIEKVWDIIAEDYENVGSWASAVQESRINPGASPIGDSRIGGRICETDLGPFEETIKVFNSEKKELVYSAKGKAMPFFVKSLQGQWRLASMASGQTHIEMTFKADLSFPFSFLMGWMMKMQFAKAIGKTLEELVYYAEKGEVHPRKLSLIAKAAT